MHGVRLLTMRCVGLFMLGLLAISCTTLKSLSVDRLSETLEEGNTVRLVLKDGKTSEMKIVAFTADGFLAADQLILYRDIQALERREFNPWTTALLSLLGFVALLFFVLGLPVGV